MMETLHVLFLMLNPYNEMLTSEIKHKPKQL